MKAYQVTYADSVTGERHRKVFNNYEEGRKFFNDVMVTSVGPDFCEIKADPKDVPMSKEEHELLSRFSFHRPDVAGTNKMATIREGCHELAKLIVKLAPESRERATAITHLQTVMMFANSAIVQSYPINGES